MNDIPPIPSTGQVASLSGQRPPPAKQGVAEEQPQDSLEISETGRILSELGSDSNIRASRVAEIRQAIADGTYETSDKIDVTVNRLMDVLRGMSVSA